jgi:hypothetical protein
MGVHWRDGGYSADVRIYLLVNDTMIPVSRVTRDKITLRSEDEVPRGHAQLLINIDGRRETRDIIISKVDPVASELQFG